jgi:hypothetical protein
MLLLRALALSGALATVHAFSKWAVGPANTPPMGFNTVRPPAAAAPPSPPFPFELRASIFFGTDILSVA